MGGLCQAAVRRPEQVLKYLARYTHRVAISNSRLLSLENGRVTFQGKDYAHDNQTKAMTLHAVEFIRRFLLHVLPTGFVRIRQFGFLANRLRKKRLALYRALLGAQSPAMHASSDSPTRSDPKIEEEYRHCPVCNAGRLIVVELLKPEEIVKVGAALLPPVPVSQDTS